MSQRSMDFYLTKKPSASQSKTKTATKRKVLKISSDEDESPTKSTTTAKKRPKVGESPGTIKKQKIKAESVAALFGGELRRENKQKSTQSPKKSDNHVDCKSKPVSNTSFSTPTKSENGAETLRRSSRTPQKLHLPKIKLTPQKEDNIKDELHSIKKQVTPKKHTNSQKKTYNHVDCKSELVSDTSFSTPTKSENCVQEIRRSYRTPQKSSERKLTSQRDDTIKDELRRTLKKTETISNKEQGTPKKHESAKNELDDKSNIRSMHEDLEDKQVTAVKGKKGEEKVKRNEIKQHNKASNQSFTKKRTHKEANLSDLETSVLSDEQRFERKRMAAILFQKRQNREPVINPGSKQAPKGVPNCLIGLTFCVTGVLESFTREEAAEIVKDLGGKVTLNVGKRLNYLIAGEDAGPKKISDAESLGIPILSLDGLFQLIKEKSNNKTESGTSTSIQKKRIEQKSPFEVKKEDLISRTNIKREEKDILTNLEHSKNQVDGEVIPKPIKDENVVSVTTKPLNDDNLAWVDKYKPTSVKQIIGQQGPASNCAKLINWLKNWHSNQTGGKKLQKPNPWAKNDDGSYYKAALLSGPPGVGKTTTAILVCKELGFDIVEFNASDTRSKRLLKEEVSELLSNKSLYGYFHGNTQVVSKKHVLIMDEVDGMAGNEDRGGIQELIALIKDSHVPIICMCNDRNHQKMRSLVNYCFDLRFNKPRLEQIKGFVKSICFKEKVKLSTEKIDEIILATNNDIRQSINHLCLLSAGKDIEFKSNNQKTAQKDLKMGPWEVVRKVFSAEEHKHMSLVDKLDLFFHDYSMSPLFVQQNYLSVAPSGPKSEVLKKVTLTADALSLGDLVDRRIRTNAAWSLLPVQAVFSSFFPGEYMEGHFTGQINFPGWLGKYSRTNKRSRLAQEIHDHTRLRTSGSRLSIRMDYAPFLLSHIVRPLQNKGMQGVEESLKVIQEYRLLREDIDSLIELTTWPGKKSPMDAVEGRVKAALTRSYNKEVLPYSYSMVTAAKKKKIEAADGDVPLELMENETEIVESDEDNDNLEMDNLIKAKKTTSAANKPSSSKIKKTSSSQKTSSAKNRK